MSFTLHRTTYCKPLITRVRVFHPFHVCLAALSRVERAHLLLGTRHAAQATAIESLFERSTFFFRSIVA